jgi:hypothetical protein
MRGENAAAEAIAIGLLCDYFRDVSGTASNKIQQLVDAHIGECRVDDGGNDIAGALFRRTESPGGVTRLQSAAVTGCYLVRLETLCDAFLF